MKTVIYLIVIIGWSILQARRKAVKEQKRKQAMADQMPIAAGSAAVPLGAVSAQDNSPLSTADLVSAPEPGDQFFQDADREVPEQIKPVIEYARKAKKKKREERQLAELPVSSIGMQNYEKVDALRKHFVLDRVAIRNYVITREVLGPPRSRKPFRPAMKDRE